MNLKFQAHIKSAVTLITALSLIFPLTGCGIIIINDVSSNNVSNTDVEKNFFESDSAFTPTEYTPYEGKDSGTDMAEHYLSELPSRDYDGAVFFITTPSSDYIDPDNTDNNVSRMVYERNRLIEETYDIVLLSSVKNGDTILREMEQAVASDSYYSDLLMLPLYMTGQFRISKVLMNLRSLPFIDLDAPYFNSESVNMTSAGYETYGAAGSATLDPSAFSAVFFNRDITEKTGLEMPYSSVTEKKWTWDTFFEYTQAVSALNETGGEPLNTLAVQSNASRLADLVFVSCGNTYVNAAKKNIPKIAFTQDTAAYSTETAHRLLTDPNAVIDASSDAVNGFANGDSFFLIDYLSVMPQLSDASANWGVLPLPTENEGDEFRTLVANTELIFSVPVNHTNAEMASVILSALNAGSYGYLYDEYVAYNMAFVLRDNDSANMLDLILDSAAFDFALAFGNSYPDVAAGTYGLIREAARNNDLKERFFDAESAAMNSLIQDFKLD
ncbi:MAG: extracellular solute-binding protein [Ruminococcaceae bacterium]|nr:extracellular solute-binding protein [Oscillospiraceae bacterium]